MQNRSPPRVRRTFDTRRDAQARRAGGTWRPSVASEPHVWIGPAGRDASVLQQPLRVLVVDHDTRAADALERLLHVTGCPETRVAYTVRAAVAFAQEFRPEVVLMQLDMPNFDDWALNRALRERAQLRHMCVITTSGPDAHHEAQIEPGAVFARYLFKPITARDLAACLTNAAAVCR